VKTSDDLSSCRLQRDACRSYVESRCALGWVLIPERFDDEGYSGATLDRLLARVSRGLVDQVIVHRLDRLSRSLRDSAKLLHDFRQVDVALVVVTAPELGYSAQDSFMLNILASFAEFEREMIAARIADTRARLKQRHLRFAGGEEADRHRRGCKRPRLPDQSVCRTPEGEQAWWKPLDCATGGGVWDQRPAAVRLPNRCGDN